MRLFGVEQVSRAHVEHDGRALYSVALAASVRPGMVRVSADRHEAGAAETWIADELNRQAARFGRQIVEPALSRPLELD